MYEEYIESIRLLSAQRDKAPTYHITTFGCQMNERDSEHLSGILSQCGYESTDSDIADLIIINTCTVRENANNKLFGHLGQLKSVKQNHPEMKLALCGCMMQEEGMPEQIRSKYPFVDLIFGTGNIEKFPMMLYQVMMDEKISDTDLDTNISDTININHKFPFKSGLNIMFGCDNFCSYCIVPYVRGRERSRSPETIIKEAEALATDGVTEIMLLGQNVNSYGKGLDNPISFAKLLNMVEAVPGIERIRFMTSHPKDFSAELIETIAASDKICRHIHLPLQSGSTKILKAMNRKYTKEDYLTLVDKLKTAIPDIAITTDIIVGFPGEEEEDIEETLDVIEKAGFDSAFTFIYSRRSNTPAANMPANATEDEIKSRFDRVLNLVQETSRKRLLRFENTIQKVLVESVNEREPELVSGRMDKNFIVHFPGDASLIGKYVDVEITESKGFYYIGKTV